MIAVYVKPETLTVEQYNKARKGLDASGANMEGRKHHSCFGEDGQLMVFEDLSNRVTGGFYRAEPHSELPHCPLLQPAPLRESCSGHRDAWK